MLDAISFFSEKLRRGVLLLTLGIFGLSGTPASALTIIGINGGGVAPAGTTGSGTLTSIFNFAASRWAALIPDPHTVTITYSWANLAVGTLAAHTLSTQGGVPNRELSGTIQFDNDPNQWFLDGTPDNNSEWTTFNLFILDLGGGNMTVGNQFTGATGDAQNRFDLLSVATHEIGHALGLSAANTSFQVENVDGDVDVTFGRFAGAAIPTTPGSAHLNLPNSLMWPFTNLGTRTLISQADLVADCQISQFSGCRVPEPSSLLILAFGAAGLAVWRRRPQ
jgi:Matrixin/PEP-CTERM motif